MKTLRSSPHTRPHLRCRAALLTVVWLAAPHGAIAQSPSAGGVPPAAQAAFEAAVGTLAAANPRIQAAVDLGNLLSGATEWSAELLDQVVAIANQAGVAFDELVPSVQGCIHEPDGTPLEAVPVLAMPGKLLDGALGFTPILGLTSGRATPATVGEIPVLDAYLSAEQRARWGPGCYWMPFPITVVNALENGLFTAIAGDSGRVYPTIRVIPITPGYRLDHVAIGAEVRTSRRRYFSHPLQPWGDGQEYTP